MNLLQNDSRITEHKEKLQEEIEKSMSTVELETLKQIDSSIKIKILFFESGGVCSHHLELA